MTLQHVFFTKSSLSALIRVVSSKADTFKHRSIVNVPMKEAGKAAVLVRFVSAIFGTTEPRVAASSHAVSSHVYRVTFIESRCIKSRSIESRIKEDTSIYVLYFHFYAL